MSAAQHQALVLCSVSFVAFVFFLCFLLPSRRTKFSVFAACNLFFVALMFGAVALLDLSGGRAEIMVAVMTELPVVLIIAWVCLALAGVLPSQLPAEPVARRP
jgi:FtsH-binding integral membrane protein